jgi:hypothetical protein
MYSPSPDVVDNFGSSKFERITFTSNCIMNVKGVISAQKYSSAVISGPLLYTHNVFYNVGRFAGRFPNTTFEHNTFVRVSAEANAYVERDSHPLYFNTLDSATNATIRNNIFVDCGEAAGAIRYDQVGWYEFGGPTNSVVVEGNFVAGAPPDFGAKTGFNEGYPLLNGGDPGFVNINDPLGPDGLPFTEDDGLRLLPSSKLIGGGLAGTTPGAYLPPLVPPVLSVGLHENQVLLSWPESAETWTLQRASDLAGLWLDALPSPVLTNGQWQLLLPLDAPSAFFRLAR